jgi:hypothetical protein
VTGNLYRNDRSGGFGALQAPATNAIGSGPGTWVTECTGYMGNTFGPKGFSSGSNTRVSRSKYPKS